MSATLLALYGDDSGVELMGYMKKYLTPDDYWLLRNGQFSASQFNYLQKKYPEMMGFWALIAKAAAGVAKGIGSTVKNAIANKKQRESDERIAVATQQQNIVAAAQLAAKKQKNIMMVAAVAVPVVGAIAYFLLKK
jgi:hypothetical protein